MTDPEAFVKLTDTEFTLSELEAFVARARAIDGIPHDAIVIPRVTNAVVTTGKGEPLEFELSTSDSYRAKA